MPAFATLQVPLEIESARLLLRLPREDDARPLHAYYGDADSVRFTLGEPLAEWQVWRMVAAMIGHWALRGYGPYVLQAKAGRAVLGVAGLWFPADWPEPEIKWALVPAARGRGYASEAARAARSMARAHLPGQRLISLISIGNDASVRVAQALGARVEREIDFRGSRAQIFRHVD